MTDDDNLQEEIRELRLEVDALHRRIDTIESTINGEAPSDVSTTDTRQSTSTHAQSKEHDDTPTAPSSSDQSAQDSHSTSQQSNPAENSGLIKRLGDREQDIGVTWLGRIGGIALVIGVVFFIRVAIEAGILGPLGRVSVGTISGIVLLIGGRYAASSLSYHRWGRLTAGTGLAIAFFSIYAAYGFTAYRAAIGTPFWIVLTGLTILVGATISVSVSDTNPLVAGEAFLLGYVIAYLGLNSGNFVVTPAYTLTLTLGLVGIATLYPWTQYVAASVPLTYGLTSVWIADFDPAWSVVTGFVTALFIIYIAGSYAFRRNNGLSKWQRRSLTLLTPLNAIFAAVFLEWTVRQWALSQLVEGVGVGTVALAIAGIYTFTAYQDVSHDHIAGTTAVVLFAVSIFLAFGTFAATAGLLIALCVAVAVASYADLNAVRTGAHLVAVGIILKLLVIDVRELPSLAPSEPLTTATGRPGAFLLVISVLYGLAWWFRNSEFAIPTRDDVFGVALPYVLTATTLTVVGLGLELSGFGLSVAWTVFGAVLFGGGINAELRLFRVQGIAVFGVTTAKVFLFDTQGLSMIARTISFLVLGVILLAASYAYARRQGDRPLNHFIEI